MSELRSPEEILTVQGDGNNLLANLYNTGQFSDITLYCGLKSWKAHKCILTSTIPYFSAMFSFDSNRPSSSELTVSEDDIDPETFESILRYAYMIQLKITPDNVESLLGAANFLQIDELVKACCKYFHKNYPKERLTLEKVMSLRDLTQVLNSADLARLVQNYMKQNIELISQTELFLNFSFEDMLDLAWAVDTRKTVYFFAIIKWVKHNLEERGQHLKELFETVNLSSWNERDIERLILTDSLILQDYYCRTLSINALNYLIINCDPHVRFYIENIWIKPRPILKKRRDDNDTDIDDWDIEYPKFRAQTHGPTRFPGLALINNKMYAFGGSGDDLIPAELCYKARISNSLSKPRFSKFYPMNYKRERCGVTSIEYHIYVCGGTGPDGSSLSIVEMFDLVELEWKTITPMIRPRTEPSVLSYNELVYVTGGSEDGFHSVTDSCEVFDPSNQTWTEIEPMSSKRMSHGSAVMNGKLFVCGGYNGFEAIKDSEYYDVASRKWFPICPMKHRRFNFALIEFSSKLYAIGGCDGFGCYEDVQVYDPTTDQWTDGPYMYVN